MGIPTSRHMKSFCFLLLASIMFTACGDGDSTATDSDESTSSDTATTGSRSDSLQAVRQQQGEPGIPGSDIPEHFWVMDDGTCYAYGQRVVRVTRSGVGESIAVFSGSDRAQCNGSSSQATFSTGTDGDPQTFFGVVGDLLLLERTTEQEHLIRVVDLGSGQAVLETLYEEPVEIKEGGLFYGEPAEEFETQEGLNAVGVDCPESGAWFNDSLAVGVSVRSRFDLTSRQVELTDNVTCIPLL